VVATALLNRLLRDHTGDEITPDEVKRLMAAKR
jgi:hypothetical protein